MLAFLNSMSKAWKDKYIALFIAITPVWSGNIVSVWDAISGLDCKEAWGTKCPGGEAAITPGFMRAVSDSLPAAYWTFPTPGEEGASDGIFTPVFRSSP